MNDAATPKKLGYVDSEVDSGFSNPQLERIRVLLTQTDPERWRIGGEDLTPESRFARPRHTYEQILVRDIPTGSLALHCVQPVSSHYLPGGYSLTPMGPPQYTIEVRDKIFDAEKVVDPRYADNQKGKRCDIIASGDIAKSLYFQVKETIKNTRREKKKSFEERAKDLSQTILERIEQTSIEEWQKDSTSSKEEDDICYTTDIDGVTVEVGKKTKNWETHFRVAFREDHFSHTNVSAGLARSCFRALEEMEQNAQLNALGEVLKDIGFE